MSTQGLHPSQSCHLQPYLGYSVRYPLSARLWTVKRRYRIEAIFGYMVAHICAGVTRHSMEVSQEKDVASIATDLITTDVSGRTTVGPLMEAVDKLQESIPAMTAAEALSDTVDAGGNVVILTGFPIPPTMRQETDGPLGAVSIARSVTEGLNGNAYIMCEEAAVEVCERTATAGELNVVDRENNLVGEDTVTVEPFPISQNKAQEFSKGVVEKLNPSAIVTIEKVGSNSKGEYHNSAGYSVTEYTSKIEELIEAADESVLTISVGDAGNEVGMGKIEDTIKERIQYGSECQCGCGGGIADTTEPDILVPATVSNWGAYGITACLSQIVDQSLLHAPTIEERMLIQCSMAGAIDGPTEKPSAWVDGLPTEVHSSMVRVLNQILRPSIHERRGEESASVK